MTIKNKEKAAQKFTIEKLKQNCISLFGVSTSAFSAATYNMTGKYSVEEMKQHLETWQKETWKKKEGK